MANFDISTQFVKLSRLRLNLRSAVGVVALLGPAGYIIGRGGADYLVFSGIGMMIGVSVGLFFGGLYSQFGPTIPTNKGGKSSSADVLEKIRIELDQAKRMFEARKGTTNLFARITYPAPYWNAAIAAGQVSQIPNHDLLKTVASAYYWLAQASHLETLAYEAKYAQDPGSDSLIRATHLISEVRLLDTQLESALSNALNAIDNTSR